MISLIESCMEGSRVKKQSCLRTTVTEHRASGEQGLCSFSTAGAVRNSEQQIQTPEKGCSPTSWDLFSELKNCFPCCLLSGMQIYFSVNILVHQHSVTLKFLWGKLVLLFRYQKYVSIWSYVTSCAAWAVGTAVAGSVGCLVDVLLTISFL